MPNRTCFLFLREIGYLPYPVALKVSAIIILPGVLAPMSSPSQASAEEVLLSKTEASPEGASRRLLLEGLASQSMSNRRQ